MADKIKKVKVKQSTGEFGDYIPLGADAANVDLSNGQTVEENVTYLNTELLRAEDNLGEVPDTSFTLPTASATVLGGIKIGEGLTIDENGIVNTEMNFDELAEVAKTGDYNDLVNTPTIPETYQLPIATAANLGGVRIGTGLSIDAQTGVMNVVGQVTDYNNLENLPDLTVYAKDNSLAAVAKSGSYNDLSDTPIIPAVYNLPVASATTLGGIKIGSGLNIDNSGVVSAVALGGDYLSLSGGTLTGSVVMNPGDNSAKLKLIDTLFIVSPNSTATNNTALKVSTGATYLNMYFESDARITVYNSSTNGKQTSRLSALMKTPVTRNLYR